LLTKHLIIMINLRRVAASAVAVAFGSFVMFSCTQEGLETTPDNQISETVIAEFESLGFDASDLTMEMKDMNPFDDKGATMNYVLEGDIVVSPEQLVEMLNSEVTTGPNQEQYRTNNLVSAPRTISVIGYTGSGFALTSKMRTALQWSVNNYNRLNLDINFTVSFTAGTNADMVVYNNGASGGGGSAGFPSGGLPNKFIQINAGTNSFSTNVNEHVITHEMGHSVGFRHTDYFNRSLSCGSGGNEGSAGVGAIHIPGTPTGNDATSIMAACFSSSEDGEFNGNDITALRFLY